MLWGRARAAVGATAALAAFAATTFTGATPAASAATAPTVMRPDLTAEPFNKIKLCQERVDALYPSEACRGTGATVLRLDNRVGNHGLGPLELRADFAAELPVEQGGLGGDCHGDGDVDLNRDGEPDDNDVWVSQLTATDFNRNGVFDREPPTGAKPDRWRMRVAGCRYYHPEHSHYHLENFAEYQLLRERTWTRKSEIVRRGSKISFCVEDSHYFEGGLGLPGAAPPISTEDPSDPTVGFYDGDACRQRDSVAGISVGWFDHYGWTLSGQQIDVSGLPAGAYCLKTIVDPRQRGKASGQLIESDETNNERSVRIYIDPAAALADADPSLLDVRPIRDASGQLEPCDLGKPKRLDPVP